jgi:hypothetical protein
MKGKKQLLLLTVGFLLLIFDVVTDILVAVHYGLEGEYSWFGLTLLFIIVPLFIVSLITTNQTDDGFCENASCCLLCSAIFVRYAQEFAHWKRAYRDVPPCGGNCQNLDCEECQRYQSALKASKKSAYNFAWIRYVATLTESTPQWCLQTYVMLLHWNFPWYTVLSVVFSLLSLSWSSATLEKARIDKQGLNFKVPATAVFFAGQLFNLLSRLLVIVAFAHVFEEHVFAALAVHWLAAHSISWSLGLRREECKCDAVALFFLYIIFCFPFLFHVTDMLTKNYTKQRTINFVLYSLIAVENVLLVTLAVAVPAHQDTHASELKTTVLPVVIIGLVFGSILLVIYNKFLKPTEKPSTVPDHVVV